MADRILGICRFSYLGRGDWGVYQGTRPGSAEERAARQSMADKLFLPDRLAFRFRTFEALTLPSIAAQTDPDFSFLVLASSEMPQQWLDRLQRICAAVPQARVVISDAPDVGAALAPTLAAVTKDGQRRLVQFRLDDDDCLSVSYIESLRRAAKAMRDYPAFAFSLPRSLLITNYPGTGPRRFEMVKPFHAAGTAARMPQADLSIFAFGHYALAKRLASISDPLPFGSVQIKAAGHDSQQVVPGKGSGITAMAEDRFAAVLARDFPFVGLRDLDLLTGAI